MPKTVVPKQPAACHEAADRINRIKFLLGVPCSGIRDRQIDDGSGYINEGNGKNCRFGKRREADGIEVKQRKNRGSDFRLNQHAAQYDAENNGSDREPFNPAIGDDQFFGRKQFRENAVFGGRIGGSANADNGVGEQRMAAEKHQQTADGFEKVREEHDSALGHRVGKDAHPGCQKDVAHDEE